MTSRIFLRTVNSFLTNSGCISNDFIGIEKDGNLISNQHDFVELFNEHYINIVEKSSGGKPLSLGNSSDVSQEKKTVKKIISIYSNHPSIQRIKNLCVLENKVDLRQAQATLIK